MRTLLFLLALTTLAGVSEVWANDDPHAVVFLGPLSSKAAAAPSGEGRVILSGVSDAWKGVLDELETRGYAKTIPLGRKTTRKGLDKAFKELARLRPRFVAIVLPSDRIDVNFHFDFLERASRLDADPFVDFSFGYVTGATPAEALAALRALRERETRRSILEFGPTQRAYGPTRPGPHKAAKGYTVRHFGHAADAEDIVAKLGALKDVGVFKAWGHGYPDGVHEGLKGSVLRKSDLDFDGALYFSGPCYCGVSGPWFDPSGGSVRRRELAPQESFVLAAIKARAGAVFAGLDPDRGETNHHEFERLLVHGGPLGDASKSTYDDVVLAYRRPELELPRYRDGRPRPHKSIHDTMIAGGACRALFGDPARAPIEKAMADPFAAEVKPSEDGLEIRWRSTANLGKSWLPVDVYRAHGRWTHRLRFTVELPREDAQRVRGFAVLAVTKDGKTLPAQWATAGLEASGERVLAHLMVVFPWDLKERALWKGRAFEARFLLSYRKSR